MKSTLARATFSFYKNGKRMAVGYRLGEKGHLLSVLEDGKPIGKLVVPIHEKITISKIEFYGRRIIKDSKVKLPNHKFLNL